MESIPDELVKFLVDQIAIDGQFGSTGQDVLYYLERYYQAYNEQARSSLTALDPEQGLHDSNFQIQLWSRLAEHPDVILRRYPDEGNSTSSKINQTQNSRHITSVSSANSPYQSNPNFVSTASRNETPGKSNPAIDDALWLIRISKDHRLHATLSRTETVFCDSLKTSGKLLETESRLLSLVAASREHGISETDLVLQSGQDRSTVDSFIRYIQSSHYVKWKRDTTEDKVDRLVIARFGDSRSKAEPLSNRIGQLEPGSKSSAIHEEYLRLQAPGPQPQPPSTKAGAIYPNQADEITPLGNEQRDSAVSPDVGERNESDVASGEDLQENLEASIDGSPRHRGLSPSFEPGSKATGPRGRKKRKYKDPNYKPKGRPRKFVAGTEAFWRNQFAKARKAGKLDLGSDPSTHELFTQRPPKFDDVLLRAAEAGLPVPVKLENITQEWVDRTLEILNRTENGLYLSLLGAHPNDWKIKQPLSQVLIVKSSRLRELDLSDRQQRIVSKARFITSSAAHTFHYLRYYPRNLQKRPVYISYSEPASRGDVEARTQETLQRELAPAPHRPLQSRQPASIGYYLSSPSLTHIITPVASQSEKLDRDCEASEIEELPRKRRRIKGKIFELGENASKTPTPRRESISASAIDLTEVPPASPNPFGLPPPLTTRGARRRHQAVQEQQKTQNAKFHTQPSLQPVFSESLKFSMQEPDTRRWYTVARQKKGPKSKQPAFSKSPESLEDPTNIQEDVAMEDDSPEDSDFQFDGRDITPPPKTRMGARGGALNHLRRTILLDIVNECGGVIPYNATFPGSEFVRRWQGEGQRNVVEEKVLKAAIKTLFDGGKLKQMKFSFRCKKGNMVIKPIITMPGVEATHPLVRDLQKAIIEADPSDHVPACMETWDGRSGLLRARADGSLTLSTRTVRTARIPTVLTLKFRTDVGRQAYRSVVAAALYKKRSNRRKVTWMQAPGTKSLPESLEEILQDENSSESDRPNAADNPLAHFQREIEVVMMWEHRTFNFFQADETFSSFINHFTTHQERPGFRQGEPYQFTDLLWFTPDGKQAAYPFASTPLPDLYNDADVNYVDDSVDDLPPATKKRRILGTATHTPITDLYAFPDAYRPKKPYVRRHKQQGMGKQRGKDSRSKPQPNYIVNYGGHIVNAAKGGSYLPIKRQRGTQLLRSMPDEEIYHIAVAVVVVRTLVGGIEKFIDWDLVMRAHPDQDEQFVKDRWKTLSNRYRRDVAGLTESLQEKYLDAFERGEVPGVDFEDLESGTDWKGICDWAMRELDGGGRSGVEELPASEKRERWVEDRDFAFEDFKGMRDLLGYNVNATGPRKEEALGGSVFARPLIRDEMVKLKLPPEEEEANDIDLTRARSWVFATVLTDPEHYDEFKIRKKLMTLAPSLLQVEELVDRALKVLQRDKLISHCRDSRVAGVLEGGWEPSVKLFEYFDQKRMLTRKIFNDAAAFKTQVVDQKLVDGGSLVIEKDGLVDDGHMVALINLVATGRISLRVGQDVPRSRYGLDWEEHGYQTRLVDKRTLGFSVVVEATPEYVNGDPAQYLRKLPVPRGEMDDVEKGRIPMWFDILGNFQSEMWETVVAAIIGLVSLRAGIGQVEIGRTLMHGATMWEVALILEWAERSGFIRRTAGSGWTTNEWWWLALGTEEKWIT